MRVPSTEKQPDSKQLVSASTHARPIINPLSFLRRVSSSRAEVQERNLDVSIQEVVRKMLAGVVDRGMVSLFHSKESGELEAALYTVRFSSPSLPHLGVSLMRHYKNRDTLLGPNERRISMSVRELAATTPPRRGMGVSQTFGMAENEFRTQFHQDGTNEGPRLTIPLRDKLMFLNEILGTEIDEAATEEHFGAPYTPGGTRSTNNYPDALDLHCAYWVRDLLSQSPELGFGTAVLEATEIPAIQ